LASAKTPHEQTVLQGQIGATDRQIDRLVYELYGLTAEEIRIVEGLPASASPEKGEKDEQEERSRRAS
jgi:hypothetical protein